METNYKYGVYAINTDGCGTGVFFETLLEATNFAKYLSYYTHYSMIFELERLPDDTYSRTEAPMFAYCDGGNVVDDKTIKTIYKKYIEVLIA